MASTNKTPNLGLSQFLPLDKPAWLGDYNQDMSKIDTAVHNVQTQADSMETNVQVAITSADAATKAAQAATEAAAEATSVAQNAQTTANNVSGTATQALTVAQQAQETAEKAVPLAGGTMTGPLILSGVPTQDNQAATKAYVDSNGGGLNLVRVWANPISYSESGHNFLINFSALEGEDCVVLFLSMMGSFRGGLNNNITLGSTTLPIDLTKFPQYRMICFDGNSAKTPTGVAVTFSLSGRTLTASVSNSNSQYPINGTAYTGFFSMVVQRA